MDHFSVLDPRKQELLEARIGGRVIETSFLVTSDNENGGEAPRSAISSPQLPIQSNSGSQEAGKPLVNLGEPAAVPPLVPKVDSSMYLGSKQVTPCSPKALQANVGGHDVMMKKNIGQYGSQPEVPVSSNRQVQSVSFARGSTQGTVEIQEIDRSMHVNLAQSLSQKRWDKTQDSDNKSNKHFNSADQPCGAPDGVLTGAPEMDDNSKTSAKINKSSNCTGTPDKPLTGDLELDPTGEPVRPSSKKTPKAKRHLTSPRGTRGNPRLAGEVARVGARSDSQLQMFLEAGRLEKVRDIFTDSTLALFGVGFVWKVLGTFIKNCRFSIYIKAK